MKKRFVIFLIFTAILNFPASAAAQNDFDGFWTKFRNAVKSKNKAAVAAMTRFPLSMPYGMASVKNKTQLAERFGEIFDGEANASKCFAAEKPQRDSASKYSVACGFKGDNTGEGGKPIVYSFERTKTGWKFIGFDNINE